MNSKMLDRLKEQNFSVTEFIDWDQSAQTEEITIALQELKNSLQTDISQSIEEHTLGKQKFMGLIEQNAKIIAQIQEQKRQNYEKLFSRRNKSKRRSTSAYQAQNSHDLPQEENLDNLVEMISIKAKADYCLKRLDPIINQKEEQE